MLIIEIWILSKIAAVVMLIITILERIEIWFVERLVSRLEKLLAGAMEEWE